MCLMQKFSLAKYIDSIASTAYKLEHPFPQWIFSERGKPTRTRLYKVKVKKAIDNPPY